MNKMRRHIIKSGIGAALTWLTGIGGLSIFREVHAGSPENAFLETDTTELLRDFFPGMPIVNSDEIALVVPEVAENGAIVPISVTSTVKNVESVSVIVEKNPRPLAAHIRIGPDTETWLSTRIRMAETSDVLAIVKAESRLHAARRLVTVTIGGCEA